MKRAFSLLELVVVIVIFTLVASLGSDVISQIYLNYLKTQSINTLESKTQVALEVISKRLSYRIKNSLGVARGGVVLPLDSATPSDKVLIWISYSNESYLGKWEKKRYVSGWSGLVDLDESDKISRSISTPGSHLGIANSVILALTNNKIGFTTPYKPVLIPKSGKDFDIFKYYTNATDNYTSRVRMGGDDRFILQLNEHLSNDKLYEQYYLAHTAYALVLNEVKKGDFTLMLRYNFQPWNGQKYDDKNTPSSIVAQNVSTFRFKQIGNSIRIKLCIKEEKSGQAFSVCKETVVL